jgi:signal peptidase II
MIGRTTRKTRVFWPLLLSVFLADCTTKRAAVETLSPPGIPHEVLGDVVRLTLVYNEGAAMGLPVGPTAINVLGLLAVAMVVFLLIWYRRVPKEGVFLPAALALIVAGAMGNGWERLFSTRGVVDFIDIGLGAQRFFIFNVADVGITGGAILLAAFFWWEDRREAGSHTFPPQASSRLVS